MNLSKGTLAETKKKRIALERKSFESTRDTCYILVFISVSIFFFFFCCRCAGASSHFSQTKKYLFSFFFSPFVSVILSHVSDSDDQFHLLCRAFFIQLRHKKQTVTNASGTSQHISCHLFMTFQTCQCQKNPIL